jgi:transposase
MARPYANDLRRKFLHSYEQGNGTLEELAEQFGVSVGWAKKISAAHTRTGQTDRLPWRRGPASRITTAVQEWIQGQISKKPDVTLMELQEQLHQAKGVRLSIGSLWQALRQLGLRLKKSHSTPRNRTRRKHNSTAKCGRKP